MLISLPVLMQFAQKLRQNADACFDCFWRGAAIGNAQVVRAVGGIDEEAFASRQRHASLEDQTFDFLSLDVGG